jgi:hypothetical protein
LPEGRDLPEIIHRVGNSIGRVTAEHHGTSGGVSYFTIETRAGWLGVNQALLLVVIGEKALGIHALAKEGWLDQKTAQGALAKFLRAMQID